MSKDKSLYLVGAAGILFSALMRFFWLPYPKGIIVPLGNMQFVPNVITSVIYYIFITVYLVSVFRILKRTKDYDVKSVVLKYIYVLIPILVAVLFLDILQLFFNSYLGYYAVIVSDLRIVVEWLIFFFVILRVLHLRKRPENKKLMISMCVLLIVALTVAVAIDVTDIADIQRIAEKYTVSGSGIVNIAQNKDFAHGLRSTVLDVVSGIIVFTALLFSRAERDKSENKKKVDLSLVNLRLFCLLVMCFMICGVKVTILPQSALGNTHIDGNTSMHSTKDFSIDTSVVRVSRAEGYGFSKEVYCMTKCEIWYADSLLYKCKINREFYGISTEMNGNQIIMNDTFDDVDVDGIEVKVLPDQAICYAIDETPYCIPLRDIKNQRENRIITDFCKKMLEDGRLEYYEYSCEYLNKYAPDISAPYTERYAAKEFTEEELQSSQVISTDYIAKLAHNFS